MHRATIGKLKGNFGKLLFAIAIFYFMTDGIQALLDFFFQKTLDVEITEEMLAQLQFDTSAITPGKYTITSSYGGLIYNILTFGAFEYGIRLYSIKYFREGVIERRAIFEGFSIYGKAAAIYVKVMIRTILGLCLFIVPGLLAVLKYSQAFYVLIDHPEYTSRQCLMESAIRMNGNKLKFFGLKLTLFGFYYLAQIPSTIFAESTKLTGLPYTVAILLLATPIIPYLAYSTTCETVFHELLVENLLIIEDEHR